MLAESIGGDGRKEVLGLKVLVFSLKYASCWGIILAKLSICRWLGVGKMCVHSLGDLVRVESSCEGIMLGCAVWMVGREERYE